MLRKKKFLVGGLVVFLALGYLIYTGFQSSATYYYEVSELLTRGDSVYGENVRVRGEVAPGSVERESQGTVLRFIITDMEGEQSLPVVYQGVVPDTFKVGVEVVVEGQLDSDGVFQAHTLMPKCPSRYVPQE
ncbi:MAG TPA: cytochrome c maturation protein CcmE [Dehalococcoidia bacterium]|jgi:cytochrome c-type biogenesis protein CcmE|nr:cytochrome c maturation protein CcmE [Dehalococcoidia bacterium]